MRRALVSALPLLALAATACGGPLIRNTKIPDNKDTRAVLEVLSKYKTAFEALDSAAVIGLVAPTYFDKGDAAKNTPPRDFAALQKDLAEDYKRIKTIKLDFTVKDLRIDDDKAEIDTFVVMHYMLQFAAAPLRFPWKDEQDDTRFQLVRVDGVWKIQSGL
jgi:hypothetical protein